MNTTEFMYLDDKIDRKFSDNYVDTSELGISEDPTAWLSETSFYDMTKSFNNITTDFNNTTIYTVGYSKTSSNAFTVLKFYNNTWTTLYDGTPSGFPTNVQFLIFYTDSYLYLVRADGNGNEIWRSRPWDASSWSKCSYTSGTYIRKVAGYNSFVQIPGTPYVYIKTFVSDNYFRFIRLDLTNGTTTNIYMPDSVGYQTYINSYPCYPFYNRKDNCLSLLWSSGTRGIYNYNDSYNSWTKIMDYTNMGESYSAAAVYMPTANETYLFGSYSNYSSGSNCHVYKITDFQSVKELAQTPYGVDNYYSNIAYIRGEFHLLYNRGNSSSSNQRHYKFANSTKYIKKTLPVSYYNTGSAVAYGDYIYFLDSSTSTKYFYRFDGESYENIGVMPIPSIIRHNLVVYNNEIHMFYGTQHYKYNISNNTWTSVSTISYSYNSGAASVVYNNQIHLLGGSGNYTAHWVWNGSSWSSKSSLPYEFNSGMAIVFNNNLYIIGGKQTNTSYNCYKYDKSGDFWYPVLSLPTSFGGGNAVVYKNNIHLFGGESSPTIHSSINPDTKRIYTYENIPIGMYAGDAVVYNNSIYLLGCGPYNNKEGNIMLKYTITSAT